ncbi:MAG: lytic transglycosylase domain-containing protein [Flavobacterium sp.]
MKKNVRNILSIVGIITISSIFVFKTEIINQFSKPILNPLVPKNIDFAGEKTPLHIADVYERMDREIITNTNFHTSTTLIIKRANKVFPIIEPILKEYNIPDDFKYLAVAESALINAVSSAGARGVWQFMPQTGKEKGLEINDFVDERYHLEKSTIAACKYLQEAKDKYGNWTLAAASYNAGLHGISKQLDGQNADNYYDLLLNEETSRYVFRILALKQIMENQSMYGYHIKDKYSKIESKTIEVNYSIDNLATFAKENNINYKILKIHNPWLRDKSLPNKTGKTYYLEIPTEGY